MGLDGDDLVKRMRQLFGEGTPAATGQETVKGSQDQ
jgi:hypothetical protein